MTLALRDEVPVAVQVRGKTRGVVQVSRGSDQEAVMQKISGDSRLADYVDGRTVTGVCG